MWSTPGQARLFLRERVRKHPATWDRGEAAGQGQPTAEPYPLPGPTLSSLGEGRLFSDMCIEVKFLAF